ncbi:unnamed protein product [Euphydryas editha]|uniref:FP protein C-terminal domain-containing protein n=1 Tax=Euphydryas editha TaxID=104508 RepID=A0AAU9V4K7_EUPED|nr:unnamed protein product [Euphydryas editha]
MSTKNCSGCLATIKNREYLQCPICEQVFDIDCANIPSKEFKSMTVDCRRNWKCPKCLIKQRRRGDNTNTPIRQATITRSPTNTTFSDDISDHTSSNVTLRTKPSKGDTTSPYVTEERLRHILRQEIADVLQATLHDLVTKELTSINQQFSSFHESLNFFNDYFENVKKELEEKSATIKILQTDNTNLQSSVNELTQRLGALEQNMRENNVEINGVPERKSENLMNTFSQLAKSIQHPLVDADVLHITRVAKSNRDNGRPRSVVVKMRSTRHRDALLAAVTIYNKKNPKNKLSSSHLGFDGPSTPVFVAEHLSPSNKSLHAATRIKAKEMGYKFVWVRGGRIYVRKDEYSQALLIRDTKYLNNIS